VSPSTKTNAKILVVDDEGGIRQLLKSELTVDGHDVKTACDGAEALELMEQEKFQLVICDMNMPKLSGLEVLSAIREREPDVEIIMMTGFATVETAVTAMKNGAYDFIQKPFNLDELLALVDKSLEKNDLRALRGVYEASCTIFQSVELRELLPIIANSSLKILNADSVTIMAINQAGKLAVTASAGIHNAGCVKCPVNLDGTHPTLPFWDQPAIVAGTGGLDVPCLSGAKSSIAHPLLAAGKHVGMIVVNRIRNVKPFSQVDLRIATIFSSQAAQAIQNANLYGQLQEARDQLVQSEKMASIGQLAAGVAHEINNPLAAILGFAQLLLEDTTLTESQRADLQTINSESLRCRTIIQDLLQFSRRRSPQMGAVDIGALIKSTVGLVQHDFMVAGVDINVHVPADLPMAWGETGLVQQVLLNLVTNARQAMEGKQGHLLEVSAAVHEKQVSIRFKDNGPGIPKDIQGKIFDPFFTTKPVGQGTGLGLSICYGIVQQHGGSLRVESDSGKGATFIVELPLEAAATRIAA